MNLLDTASLVVTPNGYKASKLYSIIPSNGTGDMTFARTGDTATRVNSSGLIETVLANKPRLDYFDGTCPKLLLEPQRTNLILQSQDISSASWSKSTNPPTIVTNVSVAPDGTTTADSIQSIDTTGFKSVKQTNSVSANSTFTYSFFVKKETSRTNYGGIGISLSGGTTKYVFVVFDETNGTQINLSNSTLTPTLKTEIFGNYYRFSITTTDNGSNTTITSEIYATLSINGTSYAVGVGSARTIWGMQLEVGAYATSYIPTTTASVTRNADSCVKTGISSLIGQTEGTIFAEEYYDASINNSGGYDDTIVSTTDGTTNNVIAIFHYGLGGGSSNKILFFIRVSNVTQTAIFSNVLPTGTYKMALAYKANDVVAYLNGVQVGIDNIATIPTTSVVQLVDPISTNLATKTVKTSKIALWKTRLTNQELATLTTL